MRRVILFATLGCFAVGYVAGYLFDAADAEVTSIRISDSPTMIGRLETQKTLCDRSEQVAFSCAIQKSGKILSVCTSKQLDDRSGYVQYRFGQPGKVELEFPAERENSQSTFGYSRYTRPLVTYLVLRFESNGYKYSLHQDSNAEEKPPVNSAYLKVTSPEPDAKPIEMTCRQPVAGSLMLLEDIVPKSNGTDVLTR